jgi:hypothetical protein
MIRTFLRNNLSVRAKHKLRNIKDDFRAIGLGNDLEKLGKVYKTDKVGNHSYAPHYMLHLQKFKFKKTNLLEIGVGGYDDPKLGANSLRMWKKYFPFGKIYSVDICEKSFLQESRIKIFQGSQVDKNFMKKVTGEIGDLDIIIDDGSHINEHVIETFEFLFPKLKDGGIYVVEDTQTSYWKDYGGDSNDLNKPGTMMNYFKSLTDSLNNKEFIKPEYKQSYFDEKVISMHFYHNLIFIYKGDNSEESNMVINNQRITD